MNFLSSVLCERCLSKRITVTQTSCYSENAATCVRGSDGEATLLVFGLFDADIQE